jgi:hypothetical protein
MSTPKLPQQVRDKIRLKHYSIRAEQSGAILCGLDKRFILFHGKRHPLGMGIQEIKVFLTHLAVIGKVAASTQNQAKPALLFLYWEIFNRELPWLDEVA